ncbi:TPA: hypothetical protein EYP66_24290 [Candidatus Poribacteria bacterium]|nr:hypothetical protein [Candidatus Poribacteria bacterium]
MKSFHGSFKDFMLLDGNLCALHSNMGAAFYKLPHHIATEFFEPHDERIVGLGEGWWQRFAEITSGEEYYQYPLDGGEDLQDALGMELEEHYLGSIDYYVVDIL